jgi:hypothetical protein
MTERRKAPAVEVAGLPLALLGKVSETGGVVFLSFLEGVYGNPGIVFRDALGRSSDIACRSSPKQRATTARCLFTAGVLPGAP